MGKKGDRCDLQEIPLGRQRCISAWEMHGGLGNMLPANRHGRLGNHRPKIGWLRVADKVALAEKTDKLPIRSDPEVQAFFRASTFTVIGDGNTALFWED